MPILLVLTLRVPKGLCPADDVNIGRGERLRFVYTGYYNRAVDRELHTVQDPGWPLDSELTHHILGYERKELKLGCDALDASSRALSRCPF